MDIELILYIIFIVIAILTRFLKGKKENAPPPSQSTDTPGERPQKALTFEELLREFTGDEASREQRQQEESYTEHDGYEEEYVDDDEVKETYERSVSEAQKLKTLDEQVDLSKPITKAHHFKGYEAEDEYTLTDDILDTLKDAEGAKKAIILSEIINRKY